MTEKEIAEKVWDLLDKQLVSASRTFDDTWKEYHLGCRDCLATTMEELEKILPRPKRKVKKTKWVNIYQDDDNESYLVSPLHDNEDEAQHASKGDDAFIDRVTVTFEVEAEE